MPALGPQCMSAMLSGTVFAECCSLGIMSCTDIGSTGFGDQMRVIHAQGYRNDAGKLRQTVGISGIR